MNRCAWMLASFALAAMVGAADGFEPPAYVGSSAGTPLTGQQGWYNPTAGVPDFYVYRYSGNALGFPAHPIGQSQFIGAGSEGGTALPRCQRSHDFSATPVWTVAYYSIVRYNGVLPATNSIGKFSLQPSETARSFNAVAKWNDVATAADWKAGYEIFDSTGNPDPNTQVPDPEWQRLLVDRWYRMSTTFSFATNTILAVSITDLATGITAWQNPMGWYLAGGAAPSQPLPTAYRFFVGGSSRGNAMGFDWMDVTPGALAIPGSFSAFRGVQVSGGVLDLFESDDSRLVYRPGTVLSTQEPPVQLIVSGTALRRSISELRFKLEGSVSIPNITQTVSLYNFTTGAFEQVDTRPATTADSVLEVVITSDPSRFVYQLGGREVRARIAYKAAGPVFAYPWHARLDRVALTTMP